MIRTIRRLTIVVAMAALLAPVGTALAAKAKPAGGSKYTGTLTATPNVLTAGDTFTVNGCGYNTALGNVIVGFAGGGWGSALDANGCFTITDIPALSGDTLPPGMYEVTAYQYVRNKLSETGETTVTVVQ